MRYGPWIAVVGCGIVLGALSAGFVATRSEPCSEFSGYPEWNEPGLYAAVDALVAREPVAAKGGVLVPAEQGLPPGTRAWWLWWEGDRPGEPGVQDSIMVMFRTPDAASMHLLRATSSGTPDDGRAALHRLFSALDGNATDAVLDDLVARFYGQDPPDLRPLDVDLDVNTTVALGALATDWLRNASLVGPTSSSPDEGERWYVWNSPLRTGERISLLLTAPVHHLGGNHLDPRGNAVWVSAFDDAEASLTWPASEGLEGWRPHVQDLLWATGMPWVLDAGSSVLHSVPCQVVTARD